jgi:hypothetical protein
MRPALLRAAREAVHLAYESLAPARIERPDIAKDASYRRYEGRVVRAEALLEAVSHGGPRE